MKRRGHVANLDKALELAEVRGPAMTPPTARPPADKYSARPPLCEVELGALVDGIFALALSLRAVEGDTEHDTAPKEKESARVSLIYQLFERSRELRNLIETGSIDGTAPAAGGAA